MEKAVILFIMRALIQSRTSNLRSLLRRLDETSDSRTFRYKIDIDWFERQNEWPEVKFQEVRWSFI